MDRKWKRLEALFELWYCYFHTSSFPALSTYLTTSSDWTGSITVSGWNRLHCRFYYILHPLLSNSLVQTCAGYLFVMCFSHLSLSSSSLQPESVCVNGRDFHLGSGFMDMVPVQASKGRTKTASFCLPESCPTKPYLLPQPAGICFRLEERMAIKLSFSLSISVASSFTSSFEGNRGVFLHFLSRLFSHLLAIYNPGCL